MLLKSVEFDDDVALLLSVASKYKEIIYHKADILNLHRVLMRHVRSLRRHTECSKSVVLLLFLLN